jgi:hypothetical protein
MAFMVRENFVATGFAQGVRTIVAVCKKCLTDVELKELYRLLCASPDKTRRRHIETSCGGCGQRIVTVAGSARTSDGRSVHLLSDVPSACGEAQKRLSAGLPSGSVDAGHCSCRSDLMRSIVRLPASNVHVAGRIVDF